LLGTWIEWTRNQCIASGRPASTQAILAGEGEGHLAFSQGSADLAYSGVGATFPGHALAQERDAVSVPLALNAVVVGVLGGYGTTAPDWPDGVPRPYSSLKVTIPELATLFGKGPFSFTGTYLDAMKARNAELATAQSLVNNERTNPLAPAGSESVTWFASTAFDTMAPEEWRTPPLSITGNPPDVPRGVHASFALADPPFVTALFELYSAQSTLKRVVADNEYKPYNYGPIWILTDLATARELGIPTVAIQNGAGEFVAPTDETLAAAAADLEEQADGTFLPDVSATTPGAYPLTFVEHAIAPAEPLLDAECEPRSDAEALLEDWLAYATGPGQSLLPDGLVPLPSELAAEATEARTEVGAATPTGECAPEEPVDPTDPPPEQPPPVNGPGLPPGIPPSGNGPVAPIPSDDPLPGGFSGGPAGGSTDDETDEDDAEVLDPGNQVAQSGQVDLPELHDSGGPGWVAAAGAIGGLALLGAVGGLVSSGRGLRLRRKPS
jgi:hypothetical protein